MERGFLRRQSLLLIGLSCCLAQNLGPAQQGVASFYGGPQDNTSPNVASFGLLSGSCGYGLLQQKQWPFWQASAISAGNIVYSSGNPKGCGACIQATCTSGCMSGSTPVTVLVTDTCDDCASTQLNINALAFEQHFQNDLSIGQVNVQWQQVACKPPGNIIAEVVDSRVSDSGFIAIALLGVGGSGVIKNMELMSQTSSFMAMRNSYGAVWQASNMGSPPYTLRITGDTGEMLTATNVITDIANGQYPTNVQFKGFGGSGSSSPPATAPAAPPPVQAPPPSTPGTPPPAATPSRTIAVTRSPAEANLSPPAASPNQSANAPAASQPSPAASNSISNSTPAMAPAAGNATAPASNSTAPRAAENGSANSPSASVPAMSPGETQLMLSSNLTGSTASAANSVVNPTITIAGRKLQQA